jgi:hypothetical protein
MSAYSLKILFGIFLVSAIVLGSFSVCPAGETTIEKIMYDKESYDGQQVSVTGTVSGLKFGPLVGGNSYTTFILVGKAGGRLNVLIWERLHLKSRQEVTVTGTYRKAWRTDRRILNNVIEASRIK